MEAPRNNQSSKWTGILQDFSNGTIPSSNAEVTFEKMSEHIPAIFKEITTQPESYKNLKAVLERYSSIDQTKGYQAVVKALHSLRPDMFPQVPTPQSFLESASNPLGTLEENILEGTGKDITCVEFWRNIDLEKVSLTTHQLLETLLKNINHISGLLVNDVKFQQIMKKFLLKLNDEQFITIPLVEMNKKEKRDFVLVYLRLCSSVYKLKPELIPMEAKEALYTRKTVRLADGEASVKVYQLKLFYSFICSDNIPAPSRHDLTKTKMTAALFNKMLDTFFTKAPSKMNLTPDELLDIHEFLFGLTAKEDDIVLTLIRGLVNNHLVRLKISNTLIEEQNWKLLNRLQNVPGFEHMHDTYVDEACKAVNRLNRFHDGQLLHSLLKDDNYLKLHSHVEYHLENFPWNELTSLDEKKLSSLIEVIKGLFVMADKDSKPRNYQFVQTLIQCVFNTSVNLRKMFLNEIEKAFPEIIDEESLGFTNLGGDQISEKTNKRNQFLELNLEFFTGNLDLDSLLYLNRFNISKIRFWKPCPVTAKFSIGFAGKIEYAQQLTRWEKLSSLVSYRK